MILNLAVLAVTSAIATEIALKCAWADRFATFADSMARAMKTLRSKRISDHFKEKMLPVYGVRGLRASLTVLVYLALSLSPFAVLLLGARLAGLSVDLFSLLSLVVMAVASIAYAVVRTRVSR